MVIKMNISDRLLSINPMTRPGYPIKQVKKIVVHYVGNPGSTALANRNYFERLSNQTTKYASSHYIIGLEGEIIRCIPDNEVAWHSGELEMNYNSLSIENCHTDSAGKFSEKTLESLYELLAKLCKDHNLNPMEDIIRHYDVTKKACPKYYVDNVDEWIRLKEVVSSRINNSNQKPEENTNQTLEKYIVVPTIGLNCREYPDINSRKITAYKYNEVIQIGEISGEWGKTDKGWVNMKYVTKANLNFNNYRVIPTIGLNCREYPDIKSKKVTAYKYNEIIQIGELSGEWGKTSKGWVNMKYVKLI